MVWRNNPGERPTTGLLGHQPSGQVWAKRFRNLFPRPQGISWSTNEMRVAAGTLTLSFWKEWRKFPPSSPSSRGVPGGLLMPLMLLGEFCRERRGGKPWTLTTCTARWGRKAFWGVLRGGAGWVRSGRRHQIHTYFWKSIYVT